VRTSNPILHVTLLIRYQTAGKFPRLRPHIIFIKMSFWNIWLNCEVNHVVNKTYTLQRLSVNFIVFVDTLAEIWTVIVRINAYLAWLILIHSSWIPPLSLMRVKTACVYPLQSLFVQLIIEVSKIRFTDIGWKREIKVRLGDNVEKIGIK
jgi:hypothetical protein